MHGPRHTILLLALALSFTAALAASEDLPPLRAGLQPVLDEDWSHGIDPARW